MSEYEKYIMDEAEEHWFHMKLMLDKAFEVTHAAYIEAFMHGFKHGVEYALEN